MAALKIFYHLSFVNVIMNIIINLGNQLLTKSLSLLTLVSRMFIDQWSV